MCPSKFWDWVLNNILKPCFSHFRSEINFGFHFYFYELFGIPLNIYPIQTLSGHPVSIAYPKNKSIFCAYLYYFAVISLPKTLLSLFCFLPKLELRRMKKQTRSHWHFFTLIFHFVEKDRDAFSMPSLAADDIFHGHYTRFANPPCSSALLARLFWMFLK